MQDNNIIRDAIDCIKILKYEIRELKVENKKLRALCDTYKTCYQAKHNDIYGRLFKYRQTLQEIKEIAETCMSKDACFECKYSDNCYIEDAEIPTYDICKLLIQKITKAEKK